MKSKKANFQKSFLSLSVALGVYLTFRWLVFEPYVIPSGSMIPNLLIHDHIFVNKFIYGIRFPFTKKWMLRFNNPQRGDVLVFRYPKNEDIFYVKRVVGLPGDTITLKNGIVESVNSMKMLNQKIDFNSSKKNLISSIEEQDFNGKFKDFGFYLTPLGNKNVVILKEERSYFENKKEIIIPDDSFFVMGDNRDNSSDSRVWGFVKDDLLIGRAEFIWLSCYEKLSDGAPFCNPTEMRWSRLFKGVW